MISTATTIISMFLIIAVPQLEARLMMQQNTSPKMVILIVIAPGPVTTTTTEEIAHYPANIFFF